MKRKISVMMIGCLIFAACGKRNQRFHGEASKNETLSKPLKGRASYHWNGISLSTSITEDEVIVPDQGELRFSTNELQLEKSYDLALEKKLFRQNGVSFFTAPAQIRLSKEVTPNQNIELSEDHLVVATYKLNDLQFKLKQNEENVGSVEITETQSIGSYDALNGKLALTKQYKWIPTEYILSAHVNADQNKISFYIKGNSHTLEKLKYNIYREGLPIREYNYPFCKSGFYQIHSVLSNSLENIPVECDIETNGCYMQHSNRPNFSIAGFLNTQLNAKCTNYDYELAKPRTEVERTGLKLVLTVPNFLHIIPKEVSNFANTNLLYQKIELPDFNFTFQK